MASTTTNYGFDVPTSSDLVKNGATQIALLGQDLDTFLFRPFTRNNVLNSSMNIWQRGTSIATGGAYTADRWYCGGNTDATVTRQVTNDTANLPNIQYCARVQRNSGSAVTNNINFLQPFETINSIPLVGKTVTFSFYARAGANYSSASNALRVILNTGTGTDQNAYTGYTGSATPIDQTATLTTTWQRFTYSATVATTATEIAPYFLNTPVGTAGANDYYEVTGVQLEVGNQVTPYITATPTYATELAACQRYYWRVSPGASGEAFCMGQSFLSTNGIGLMPFPVTMRIAPTSLEQSGTANHYAITDADYTARACTAVPSIAGETTNSQGAIYITATNMTPGYATSLKTNNSAAYIGWSAEL